MDEADKGKLRDNHVRLTEDFEVELPLLNFLLEKRVLSADKKAKIEVCSNI